MVWTMLRCLACGGQCGQVASRQMVEQNRHTHARGGAIINMSSVNAVMAIPSIAGYNASKGGVNNLTRCVAACTGTICKGTVRTPCTRCSWLCIFLAALRTMVVHTN